MVKNVKNGEPLLSLKNNLTYPNNYTGNIEKKSRNELYKPYSLIY